MLTMPSGLSQDRLLKRFLRAQSPYFEQAEGVFLVDAEGRRYIDATGGAYVVTMGHSVPEILEAMSAQLRRATFVHVQRFVTGPLLRLADKVIEWAPTGMARVMFLCGGSEATEAAAKLARQYHVERGKTGKFKVIARDGSYHGVTLGALSMTGVPGMRRQFEPMLAPFPHIAACYCYRCPFEKSYPDCRVACAEDLERAIVEAGPDTVAAFIAEPVSSPTYLGGSVPPPEYYPRIRQICDRYDVLFIADEVITAFGRTGAKFGIDHWGVVPDIICGAKGLASGYAALGAVIAHEKVVQPLLEGSGGFTHGQTFAGNPVSAASGLAVLEYMEKHDLVARAAEMGSYLFQRAEELRELGIVGNVNGRGMLMGVEFVRDKGSREPFPAGARVSTAVAERALRRGVSFYAGTNEVGGITEQFLAVAPPFVTERGQIDQILQVLAGAIREVEREAEPCA